MNDNSGTTVANQNNTNQTPVTNNDQGNPQAQPVVTINNPADQTTQNNNPPPDNKGGHKVSDNFFLKVLIGEKKFTHSPNRVCHIDLISYFPHI